MGFLFYRDTAFFLYRISFMWYSAIGFLVTITAGLIISLITGAERPENVGEELLSPPVKKLLDSLSNNVKEKLNIPLKSKAKAKDVRLKGVINVALDMSSEKCVENITKETVNERFRKTSSPA